MKKRQVYSICAMCTVRCPIMVEVEEGRVKHIWGNPHVLGGYSICARGAAGKAFQYDEERPQYPMIRDGARGSGKWKRITWDEAIRYVALRLGQVRNEFGPRCIALSDRGGPMTDFQKTFITALGSPNYFNHHAVCSNSVHHAHLSVAGLARNEVGYDYRNCKLLVLYGRNIFESLGVNEANQVLDMLERGGAMYYLDVRWTTTASKASEVLLIRPGTDYAFNLALLHVIINEGLYDREFVARWVTGIEELKQFVAYCTPQWAQKETGIEAATITRLARQAAQAAPAVIFHPGWMTARTSNDFYLRRSIYALNALLGTYEAEGGIYFAKTPKDAGFPLKTLLSQVPPATEERFDGAGTVFKHLSSRWGLAQMLTDAVYPLKAYIVMRHDPLASMPDPVALKKALDRIDFLVTIDVNYSETAWYSDIILPESTYLERTDHVFARNGLKPSFGLRRQAVPPLYDSRPRSFIFQALARELGLERYFPYRDINGLVNMQLEETGFTISDFDATGIISLVQKPVYFDRKNGLPFRTPSRTLELISPSLEACGIPSFEAYTRPPDLKEGTYRLITGKTAVHTQGRTTANNPVLHDLMAENFLVINENEAKREGIQNGETVEVSAADAAFSLQAVVTPFIHQEAVYMHHGFGDTVTLRTRSFGKGVSDVMLQKDALKVTAGGNCPLTECTVSVRKRP